MEEMRQMISSRHGRPLSAAFPSEPVSAPAPAGANDETVARLESLTGEADKFLERASKHQADVEIELSELQAQYHEVGHYAYPKESY